MEEKINVAAVQMAPVYLDSQATIAKMCEFLEKAADKGARLVVFPELIISMYPTHDSPEYREIYNEAAIKIPGAELNLIKKIAKKERMHVVSGLIEKDKKYDVIYNSSIIIDDRGNIAGKHRKIALPPMEKTFFKQGNYEDIKVFKNEIGNIGIAMCYEHLNSLYRRSLYKMKEQIHCALWVNTDHIKHIVDSTAKVTAMEGLVYVIIASQVTPKRDKPGRKGIKGPPRNLLPFIGGSGILSPNGTYLSGPVYGKETIIFSEIAVKDWQTHEYGVDPRDDLFNLSIKKEASLDIKG